MQKASGVVDHIFEEAVKDEEERIEMERKELERKKAEEEKNKPATVTAP